MIKTLKRLGVRIRINNDKALTVQVGPGSTPSGDIPAWHSLVMLDLTSRFCMRMAHLNPPRLQVTLVFS
ncbi:MAG TPA: hypothetical protein VHX44_18175, partial [Planctomycetota bacterium]|nr:hypothetical protein [Planctomycetota bacterium]